MKAIYLTLIESGLAPMTTNYRLSVDNDVLNNKDTFFYLEFISQFKLFSLNENAGLMTLLDAEDYAHLIQWRIYRTYFQDSPGMSPYDYITLLVGFLTDTEREQINDYYTGYFANQVVSEQSALYQSYTNEALAQSVLDSLYMYLSNMDPSILYLFNDGYTNYTIMQALIYNREQDLTLTYGPAIQVLISNYIEQTWNPYQTDIKAMYQPWFDIENETAYIEIVSRLIDDPNYVDTLMEYDLTQLDLSSLTPEEMTVIDNHLDFIGKYHVLQSIINQAFLYNFTFDEIDQIMTLAPLFVSQQFYSHQSITDVETAIGRSLTPTEINTLMILFPQWVE